MTFQQKPVPADQQEAEALVLSCIDFRLVHHLAAYLEGRGLAGRYDQISLAGAAVGILLDETDTWARAFWDHLALARRLHAIRRLIVVDHRDCGACKSFVGETCAADPDRERATHRALMSRLADEVRRREPGLEIELILMDLDGNAEVLDPEVSA